MRIIVTPALEAGGNPFEWYVDSDWGDCAGALASHFDEYGWPYGHGDLIVKVEGIGDLSARYERETAERLVARYTGKQLDHEDVEHLCHVLFAIQGSWGSENCACALKAAEIDGWSVEGLAGQADDDGWGESAASTDERGIVEGILSADGDSCPDWLLDNIEYGFVADLDFVSKVSLDNETYYVYVNN